MFNTRSGRQTKAGPLSPLVAYTYFYQGHHPYYMQRMFNSEINRLQFDFTNYNSSHILEYLPDYKQCYIKLEESALTSFLER